MCLDCSCSGLLALSRRELLGAVGAAGTLAAMGLAAAPATQPAVRKPETPADYPLVYAAFLRPKGDYWLGWPGTAWDPKGFAEKARALTEGFARELKVRVAFEDEPLHDAPTTAKFVEKVKADKPQGVLLFPLHMYHWGHVDAASKSGVPTIIFAPLGVCFTGHIQGLSRRPGVFLASSTDFELGPVKTGLRLIRAHYDIRRTRILVVAGKEAREVRLDPLGLSIKYVPRDSFPDALKAIPADAPEVVAMADEYAKGARKIVEPTRVDLINAARNYLAARKLMEEHDCDGISMDCLGLVTDRQIPCPPCMAWARLLDAGKLGVCEADINAVLSQALCCALLGRPGFIQDPVPETVRNTFIGAHCVCPTKLDGPDGPAMPYVLRSHSESNLGVSLQVIWPEGREVTVMQMMGPGKMILGRGKVLRNLETPPAGGCRTSVELALDAPADTRDTKGFHQLFITGDVRKEFSAYAQMYGLTVESI